MRSAYIAARFGRGEEALALAKQLEEMGYTITSTWYLPGQPTQVNSPTAEEEVEWNRRIAHKDASEIMNADTFITLSEDMNNLPQGAARGGRHAEFGIAIAQNARVALIGPREHIFHWLEEVNHWNTVEEFLDYLREINSMPKQPPGTRARGFSLPKKITP